MANPEGLEPPRDPNSADPGAHQLAESSDSEDQFTDAQSGPVSPNASSPVPKTRVERVDDQPAHGEVTGTDAHAKRLQDAEPDEIAIIPDTDDGPTPVPGQPTSTTDIPTTVVQESAGNPPGPHSADFEAKRAADASPDLIVASDGSQKAGDENSSESTVTSQVGEETSPPVDTDPPAVQNDSAVLAAASETQSHGQDDFDDNENNDEGDDFDDFEEGDEDDDFDDFEDGFQQAEPMPPMPAPIPEVELPFSIPDFDGMTPDDIMATTEPYLASLFPPEDLAFPDFPPAKSASVFSTDRSASLWSQLVAPPPLAPPDWIRSRTRRLFLVSLGVPVDLDEILPASKQKKLVLPSLNIPASASPRTSSESRSLSRLRQEGGGANGSSTSIDTQGKPSSRTKGGKKGPPPQPDLDLVSARHLCMTTGEALNGMTDEELKEHVSKLEAMQGKAKDLLEYWQKRTDEKIGDREAFEGVIENLVKHARKVRK